MRRAALALLLVAAAPRPIDDAAAPRPRDDAAAIRAARAHNNAVIAAHDVTGLRASYVDDYTGIRGTGGQVVRGADAVVANFATDFAAPSFVAYVRTPNRVTVAVPRDRAMERGHWVGTWRHPDARRSGEYLAVWVPVASGWKLRSESFVTLRQTDDVPQPK